MRKRRIIGIDPGLAHTGFGIVDALGEQKRLVSYGIIETAAADDQGTRLLAIHNRLVAILQEFRPDEASMETLYFARNVTSALGVAEAKGVVTMTLAQFAVPLALYAPNQIKTSVTGTGRADKELVERCVKVLLRLEVEPKPDHAADALAAAITHIHSTGIF
ncbi:MAG: crossover junction endodeoxyribonuclease RuvC [Treponemataceae bacterium]|nr:crossover junction endodeoxyribonuclease RuvC [Treponema sp.]MDE6349993.1 crossover junction endodeoxyribonuclease RuvC [Treponemataceae bacterium]